MVGVFGKKDILYKSEDVGDEFQKKSQFEINQEIDRRLKAPADKVTFTIVADPSDAEVTINGEVTSSVSVDKGSTVSWEVSKEGYETQNGEQVVEEDVELPITLELAEDEVVFGDNDTTKSATFTINGEAHEIRDGSSYIYHGAHLGDSLEWECSKEGYITQSGTYTVTSETRQVVSVTLEAAVTITVNPTPSDAVVVINGEERLSITVAAGTEVEWSASAEGYISKSGTLTAEEDKVIDVVLDAESGVYVAYVSDEGVKGICSPSDWDVSLGEAQGVLVVDGEHKVLIAPTQMADNAQWGLNGTSIESAAEIYAKDEASEDFGGKANTAACVEAGMDDTMPAGWCNAYEYGSIGAGEWWLPACGEMLTVMAKASEVNEVLEAIGGKSLSGWYWSSTQRDASNVWGVSDSSSVSYYGKTSAIYTRAVSSFDYEVQSGSGGGGQI